MLTFEEEFKKLEPLIDQDTGKAYRFLEPLLIPPHERAVVLYAAGKVCERIYKYLYKNGIQVSAICDKNQYGKKFLDSGLTIIHPDELYQRYRDAWIVVCTFYYSVDAIKGLCLGGIPEENIIRATYTSNNAYFTKEDFLNTPELYNGYKYAYELAIDDTSKRVVLDVLRKDLSGCYFLTKTSKLPEEMEYFDFHFDESEVFVQAGCYIGDTVESFIRFRNHNPNDVIYTFETDNVNYKKSKETLSKYPNVYLYQSGLWEKNDTLCFHNANDGTSRLSNIGWASGTESMVKVVSMDSFFADKPKLPTFIQLDIEGAEPQALLGAQNILKNAKPKLAICVYHCQDHIYKIPKIIQEINPDYKRFRFVQGIDRTLFDTILFAD